MVLYGRLWYGMGAYYRWVLSTDGAGGLRISEFFWKEKNSFFYASPKMPRQHIHDIDYYLYDGIPHLTWTSSQLESWVSSRSRFSFEGLVLPTEQYIMRYIKSKYVQYSNHPFQVQQFSEAKNDTY